MNKPLGLRLLALTTAWLLAGQSMATSQPPSSLTAPLPLQEDSAADEQWDEDLADIFGDEPVVEEAPNTDPLEKLNRFLYRINDSADRYLLIPIAEGYRAAVPKPGRNAARNFTAHLNNIRTSLNLTLQGKFSRLGVTMARFAINTTLGFGGLFDPATDMGLPLYTEDFGQTLGVWGIGPGPYIVIPFLGPSTLRDSLARIPDYFLHPQTVADSDEQLVLFVIDVISAREALLGATSLLSGDEYLAFRDAYLSLRAHQVSDGKLEEAEENLDEFFDEEFFDEDGFEGDFPLQQPEDRSAPEVRPELFAQKGWDAGFPYPLTSYSERRRLLALGRQAQTLSRQAAWSQMPALEAGGLTGQALVPSED